MIFVTLYFYHFSTVIDFSSEKYSGSTGDRNSWVPVEKFSVRMPMMGLELTTPRLQTKCSAIELCSSKAIAGKELSLSSWCTASLYFYHFSTVIDFSSEKHSGSTGHRNSWYQ